MLYFTLIVCGFALFLANVRTPSAIRRPNDTGFSARELLVIVTGALLTLTCVFSVLVPTLFFQTIGIAIVWIGCRIVAARTSTYRWGTVVATGVAFGLKFYFFTYPAMQDEAWLRQKYAFASMAERVPAPRATEQSKALHEFAAARLKDLDDSINQETRAWRESALKSLHESAVGTFINSSGFGVGRLNTHQMLLHHSRREDDEAGPVSQPAARDTSASATGDGPGIVTPYNYQSLHEFHRDSILNFTFPKGFGYVKDRQQVAGFQSHRFSQRPENPKPWELQTLDLMGLVVHAEPTVYVSANLPRMDELKKVPTRAPDEFEAAGLEVLCKGEDLYMRESTPTLRLLGAIRAADKCVKCHGCERGDMLGAFSYTLRRPE